MEKNFDETFIINIKGYASRETRDNLKDLIHKYLTKMAIDEYIVNEDHEIYGAESEKTIKYPISNIK